MNSFAPAKQSRAIAIVDPCCSTGYTPQSLEVGGLGGTEATVLRVSGALSGHTNIVHFQKGRHGPEITAAGTMLPLQAAFALRRETTFVVINSWKVAIKLRKTYPDAPILLWLHIHPGRHNRPMATELHGADIGIICVSRSHSEQLRKFLGNAAPVRITYIYNPIADDLRPDDTQRNLDRLLFASSPHKGLAEVFARFRAARAAIPTLTLEVADPGYLAWDTGPVPEGVRFLGTLPHAKLLVKMRKALCLFYPQTTFAETFGIVLAEAHAVGTPVLVDRAVGANAEVVGDPTQLVDGTDDAQIVARLREWRARPPLVAARPEFRLDAVAQSWAQTLGVNAVQCPATAWGA